MTPNRDVLLRRLKPAWHRLRRHSVKDLGYPLNQHRIWCYSCAKDLLPWDAWPPLSCCLCGDKTEWDTATWIGDQDGWCCRDCAGEPSHV